MSTEPPKTAGQRARLRWIIASAWLAAVGFIVFCADRRWFSPVFTFITSHKGFDKIGHFLLIGGTAFLLNIALGLKQWRAFGRGWLVGSILVAIVFTLEEFSQRWFASRTFDLVDLAADYVGILFFGWLARRVFGPGEQV